MASYPTSVKSFGAITDGDTVTDEMWEEVYDEVVALENALVTTGLAHHVFPDATTRTLGTSAKPWGTTYVNALAYVGDTANANMTSGLTINQGAADDEIVCLKSSDVAHGLTSLTETDTYGMLLKQSGPGGGLEIRGLSDADDASSVGLRLRGVVVAAASTTKSTAGLGVVSITAHEDDAGTTWTTPGANANLLTIAAHDTTRFILDADGDSHQDVGTAWTNFDDGDDLVRLDAVAIALAREGDPLREAFVRSFEAQREVIEAMPGKPLVTFNDDGHHFVNMSRLAMLLTGAVRQLARDMADMRRVLPEAR